MIGQQVGRFRVVAKLGEGGMGTVWRAEDPLLGRIVALKLMRESADSEQARKRFVREARATSALDHPGVAQIFDVGEHDGRLFIAIAFVDGHTIHDALADGPLPLREAVRLAAEAAEALEHAHTHGIIHRDISARNVMRARDGRAVVIDFGIAALRGATRLTSAGTAMGTLPYTAPEILRNEPATRLSDLYSLGVVLYEMVAGRLPYLGDQQAATVHAILNSRLVPPRSHRPETSIALDRLIVTLLAREPARRVPSAAELAARLRGLRLRAASAPRAPQGPIATPTGDTTPLKRRATSDRVPARKLLAVMPFRTLDDASHASGLSELALGLAEAVSASLSRVPRLQVYPPGQQTIADDGSEQVAARRMGANLLLRGTVRRNGDRIRVSYSLIDARRGLQLAGDQLDGSLGELLALEDTLLGSILRSLRVKGGIERRVSPLDASAHESYLRALGHLQRRDKLAEVERAVEILEGLIESEGDTAPVHAALAQAYLRKAAITFQPEWRGRAEASCRIALSLDPHSPEVLVILGRVKLETGKVDEAIEVTQRSLALRSQNLEALVCLTQALSARSRFDEAVKTASEAVAQRPEFWVTHDQLAMVYFSWGRFEQAAQQWRIVAELVPDHVHVHGKIGASLFHLGRLEEAEQEYRRSLEIHPHPSVYTGLGTVLFFVGERESSLEMFAKATELRPEDPRTWTNLGDAQRWTAGREADSRHSFERGENLIRRRLAAGSESAELLSQLAKVLAKRNRPAESVEAIERALLLAPQDVSAKARAVTVYHLAGNDERANHYLKLALDAGYSRVEMARDPELEGLMRSPEAIRLLGNTTHETWSNPHPEKGNDTGTTDIHHR